jgi:hypothetical protein
MRVVLIATLLAIALLAGCVAGANEGGDTPTAGSPGVSEPSTGSVPRPVIVGSFGTTPDTQDPYTIGDIWLDGDLLHLQVSHSGGCREHTFELVWSGAWRTSLPAQTGLWLAHDAHGDACEAWVTGALSFDLTPLRERYEADFGQGPATITLSIGDTDQTVSYSF